MSLCAKGKTEPENVSVRLGDEASARTSRKAGFNFGTKCRKFPIAAQHKFDTIDDSS